jgi:tRNA-splicing ligase RtcB (3'-phosphate/5'-hydroxy nucleic acid ligase)
MSYNLKNIAKNKQELQTKEMKIPAILHVSNELLPNDETLGQIENLAKDERLFHHVAEMSDVHSKKGRKVPTGSVAATESTFLPQINDTAPNCGMRLVKTNLTDKTATPEIIDKLFRELVKVIPTKKYVGTPIPYDLAFKICKSGSPVLIDHLGIRTKNEIRNTFAGGNFFRNEEICNRDILDAIPELFIHIGKYRLGILGAAGNHFLDLMKISEIKNQEIAEKFGLKNGQFVFMIHTGSGLFGQYSSYMYTPKKKEHLSQQIILKLGTTFFASQMKKVYENIAKKIESYKDKEEFFGYDDSSLEGRMFFNAHRASANFGFANRMILTHHLDTALEKVFGKQIELDLLYDTTHISIEKENHFGQDVWVHRNGSVRANGPARMQEHPVFGITGEPVFIPSSMSSAAYIAVGTDNNESTFFSAPHGTGLRKHSQEDAAKNKAELFKKMEEKNVRLYNAKSKGVVLQDSSYYKDIEEVIAGMEENGIVNVVAKMEPVAVLMY